jgi:O-antigen/teichoic acid export membrane protein
VLPQYAGALPAVRPYLAGLFPLAIALPLRNVLVTVGASGLLLRLQTVLLVLLVVLQISAALSGLGIVGVAWTGAIVWTLLLAAFLLILRSTGVLAGREVATAALHTVLACAAALALDTALDHGVPPIDTASGLGIRAGATGSLALAMAVFVVQRTRGRPS